MANCGKAGHVNWYDRSQGVDQDKVRRGKVWRGTLAWRSPARWFGEVRLGTVRLDLARLGMEQRYGVRVAWLGWARDKPLKKEGSMLFDLEAIKLMSLKQKADLLPDIEKAIENARDALAEIATTTASSNPTRDSNGNLIVGMPNRYIYLPSVLGIALNLLEFVVNAINKQNNVTAKIMEDGDSAPIGKLIVTSLKTGYDRLLEANKQLEKAVKYLDFTKKPKQSRFIHSLQSLTTIEQSITYADIYFAIAGNLAIKHELTARGKVEGQE